MADKLTKHDRANRLHEACSIIEQSWMNMAKDYMLAARCLCAIHDQKLWKGDGCEARSFDDWMEQGPLKIKRTTAYDIMKIYREFGHIIGYTPGLDYVELTKLRRLLPVVKLIADDEKKVEWLFKAKENTVKDFETNIAEELRGQTPPDECDHEITEVWLRCKCCHKFFREIKTV